jgi:hypothetical protein
LKKAGNVPWISKNNFDVLFSVMAKSVIAIRQPIEKFLVGVVV